MSKDSFDDRRKTLEDEFFKKQNEALVKRMKEASDRAATREEIRALTGITQDHILDALANMKVGAAATMVVSLYPVIEVAWADGVVSDAERRSILEQAAALGIKPGGEASLFLAHWLDQKPDETWMPLWKEFLAAIMARMSPDDRVMLKNEVIGRAKHVAEASGGVLGLGWSISAAEKAVLKKLEKAFT